MATILKALKKKMMDSLVESISSNTESFYVFGSKHTEWDDELSPDATNESVKNSILDVKKEMMFGKKIDPSDIAYMVRKIDWSANTKYASYDHRDDDLYEKDFFVINTSNNVYKCLDNNSNGYSTTEPTSMTNTAFEVADGYVWKYMFSLSSANAEKFSTSSFIPVDANTDIINSAVDGSIEIIVVENGGSDYKTTNGTIQSKVSNNIFKIETIASSANDYYNGSSIYIDSGSGSGSISRISDYVSNSSGRFVVTANSLPTVDVTSTYVISPTVQIVGNGSDAKAHCTVNAISGAIIDVKMIDVGQGYDTANAVIVANTLFGSNASLTAILSPTGGHGSSIIEELGCEHLSISVDVSNTESNTISTDIEFRQAGILANPKDYSNTSLDYDANTFSQLTELTVSTGGSSFVENEVVAGLSSEAWGIVAYSNTTQVQLTSVVGSFANSETVIGQTSAVTGQISNINNPNVDPYSGKIYYYDNFEAIQRSNTAIETVRLILNF